MDDSSNTVWNLRTGKVRRIALGPDDDHIKDVAGNGSILTSRFLLSPQATTADGPKTALPVPPESGDGGTVSADIVNADGTVILGRSGPTPAVWRCH